MTLESLGSESVVPYDALLVAVGRTPRTDELGLDSAGIALADKAAVRVDRTLRTTNPRVWAAGDLTGHPQFTHVAGVHGSLAATNAILGLRRAVDASSVPRVTFTDPEVAAVGARTWPDGDARDPRVITRHHEHVDRAITDGTTSGFARLALGWRHRIIGATVVGPRAGESLGELVLGVRKKLTTSDLAGTTHAYPTYDDGPWNAALQDVQGRLDAPLIRGLIRALAGARWALTRS
ncbi:FAD-dependent oxidoreductase [Demequina sp.]|uniref:FAD-dependent oxidoreductase n=1 Tax=Demequina sp. TaxID=2050685 RepID=UPI0025BF3BBF|nr:FAD-dependent oxidoreductase [Demequina sp.]